MLRNASADIIMATKSIVWINVIGMCCWVNFTGADVGNSKSSVTFLPIWNATQSLNSFLDCSHTGSCVNKEIAQKAPGMMMFARRIFSTVALTGIIVPRFWLKRDMTLLQTLLLRMVFSPVRPTASRATVYSTNWKVFTVWNNVRRV